jgi:hypothetical protein
MANIEVVFGSLEGKTDLNCFPELADFDDWETLRKEATEDSSPDEGRYRATLDDTYERYLVYDGATVPASHNDHIGILLSTKVPTTVVICPEAFPINPATLVGKKLSYYNDEEKEFAITLLNEDGTEYTFDGTELDFVIEDCDRNELAEVLGISSVTNTLTVTIPAIPPQEKDCCGTWSLRIAATGETLASHPAIQKYSPYKATTTTTTTTTTAAP